MQDDPNKILNDQLNSLSPAMREAIGLSMWKVRLADIAKKENLSGEVLVDLETETALMLYGILPPEDYVGNLIKEVTLSEEQAEKIGNLVADEIIAEIDKHFQIIEATHKSATVVKQPEQKQEPYQTTTIDTHETVPHNLPIAEEGEKVHDTTPEEKKWLGEGQTPWAERNNPKVEVPKSEPQSEAPTQTITPAQPQTPVPPIQPEVPTQQPVNRIMEAAKPSYPSGKDPYREPIE